MKKRRLNWTSLLFPLSALCFIVLSFGFFLSTQELFKTTDQPKSSGNVQDQGSKLQDSDLFMLGLGDSLTRGIGDKTGDGYFDQVKKTLQAEKKGTLSSVNLAISGQTSSELVKQMKQEKVQSLIKKADWITITIGGNDLFRGSGRLESIDLKSANQSKIQYEKNLHMILDTITSLNHDAVVYVFGLYNPFSDLADEKTSSALVAEWNLAIQQRAADYDRVVMVPTFDLFQLQPNAYLYSDHFHPNQAGYTRMANRLIPLLQDHPGEDTSK
ncbi:GDSL family lipase [Hazenella sp. IB182353]|uniref:GDSL-type esterase/lipase family protein n=1 Tax=Polycladospora coralii TaxID=2771432 RepID=UPI001746B7A8|nr:GDSL-type esterase/lipase family protein [Polycladospora coralii]MBS7529218.1 GDSL family lipase [Polycladospora coralii]